MTTITCTSCGIEIQIDKALEGQIEARVLAAERHKHAEELLKIRAQAEADTKKEREAALAAAARQLDGEKELLKQQAQADLELTRKKLELEASSAKKQAALETEARLKTLQADADSAKAESTKLRQEQVEILKLLREEKQARANAELDAQKKLAEEEAKIRDDATRLANETQRLNLAAKEKTITDLQKSLDEAQRKAAQGSQQLQGEIMELDLEQALANHFRDDDIMPVAKGVNGADIAHCVKSPRGIDCGTMLWEIKRTKHWVDGWVPKLKTDMRAAKASIAIIVTEAMPKHVDEDMGHVEGVWVCRPQLAIMLGTLLRKGLLDAGREKALAQNRGDKADALFNFVTSHEFIHQIESMVETYQEMTLQIQKERVTYERLWALREKQAQKLLLGTANIIGSMQGHIGQASMPKIKGLELLVPGEEAE